MLQAFLGSETAEVIVDFKGKAKRIHLLVATPAVRGARPVFHPLAKCLLMVRRDNRIHGDRHVGNRPGQQLLANPFATVNGIRLQVLSVGNQPGGMGQNAFAVGNGGRLIGRIVPRLPI